jgi:hypothetical protein
MVSPDGTIFQNAHFTAEGGCAMSSAVPCEHCTGPTTFTTELQPLGSQPGHRVFFCDVCKRYTWTEFRIAQQQQQPQKKNE